ncbi:DUF21 domain-containing protein [bacterium AH-315-E10]|nr:DUF21 domain-containing protein [bacterium AH-315-E10]
MLSTYLIITIFFIFASACFSGFENGMMAMRRARLDHAVEQGQKSAKLMQSYLNHPVMMLGTILLGNNLCNCLSAIYFDESIKKLWPDATWLPFAASIPLAFIIIIFAEVTPKVWFRQSPFLRCRLLIYPIHIFRLLFYIPIKVLTGGVNLLNQIVTGSARKDNRATTAVLREDFRLMLRESEEEHMIDSEARYLLDGALDYHTRIIKNAMVTKDAVITVSENMTVAEAIDISQSYGISRFPICSEYEGENWIGIFSIYDVFFKLSPNSWETEKVSQHCREIKTVRETEFINTVLPQIHQYKHPLLIAINSSGEHTGVISALDTIYPLFGKIQV